MNNGLQIAVAAFTLLTLFLGIIGLSVRFILLPYLQDHLFAPVAQINTQVSVNGNQSETPTILDALHDVQMETRATGLEVQVLGLMFDGHLEHAENKDKQLDAVTRRVGKVERKVNRRD